MNKSLFSVLVVMLLMSVSVLGFNYYENYTLNESMVVAYDNFNRVGSEVGNMTYGLSWVETESDAVVDSDAFYTDGSELIINGSTDDYTALVSLVNWDGGTHTIEFDMKQDVIDQMFFRAGNLFSDYLHDYRLGAPFFVMSYTANERLVMNSEPPIEDYYLPNPMGWHHYKVQMDVDNELLNIWVDDGLVATNRTPMSEWNYYNSSQTIIQQFSFWNYGSSNVGEYEVDNFVAYEGTDSPYYQVEPPCEPNWTCSGYGDCLINDTQPCNETTDENMCGVPYEGDYTEFEPLVCDFCTPLWTCVGYESCLKNNTQVCNDVLDTNYCGENYTGNFSEFPDQFCQYPFTTSPVPEGGMVIIGDTAEFGVASDVWTGDLEYTTNRSYLGGKSIGGTDGYHQIPGQPLTSVHYEAMVYDDMGNHVIYFSIDNGNDQYAEIYVTQGDTSYQLEGTNYAHLDTNVSRTLGWHKWEIDINSTTIVFSIDETEVLTGGVEMGFTNLITGSAYWLGGTSIYFDNVLLFAFPMCMPDWNCSVFDDCVEGNQACLNVTDLNTCGEPFGGLLSDYDESCEVVPPITGYVPLFKSGDLPGLFGDLLGNGLYVLIGLTGLAVLGVVGYFGVQQVRKTMKEVKGK